MRVGVPTSTRVLIATSHKIRLQSYYVGYAQLAFGIRYSSHIFGVLVLIAESISVDRVALIMVTHFLRLNTILN